LKMRTKMPTNAKVVKQGDYLVLYDSSNNILKNLPVTFYSKKNHSELFETTFSDSNGKVLIPSVLDYDHFSFYAKDHYFIERKLDF